MEVRFVDVDQDDLPACDPLVQAGEPLQKRRPLVGIAFAEEFLALLPTRVGRPQHRVQGRPRHRPPQLVADPLPQLLQRPAAAREAVRVRLGSQDGFDDAPGVGGRKKGA